MATQLDGDLDTGADAPPRTDPDSENPTHPGAAQSPEFQAAVQRAADVRVADLERRWQSKKDREIHRERLRFQREASAGSDLDPDLMEWIAQADATEIGDWLKQQIGQDAEAPAARGNVDAQDDEFVASDPGTSPDQADARERLADARKLEPTPDISPGVTVPQDAFQAIEARFARGEISLADYEAARRRRGLE